MARRHRVVWQNSQGLFEVIEPSLEEWTSCTEALATAYNDPHNRTMMDHAADMSPAQVVELYAHMTGPTRRVFLLYRDGTWMGDADLRHIISGRAEFAFMIGNRTVQGKGLGTKFAIMVHQLAFAELGVEQVYATILPQNAASRRAVEKIGYLADDSATARSYADHPTDVCMSLTRAQFARAAGELLSDIHISYR